MSIGKIVAIAMMGGAIAVGGTAVAQKSDGFGLDRLQLADNEERGQSRRDDDRAGMAARGPSLSLSEITQRLADKGYGDIREVEREGRGRYEVKARNAEGHWVELYVDGATGAVLKEERE